MRTKLLAVGALCLLMMPLMAACGRKKANEHFTRGTVFMERKQYEDARREYEKGLEEYPDHYQSYYGLGVIDLIEGKHEQALENFNMAISLKPDFSGAYYQKARAYSLLSKGDPSKAELALDALERAVELDPKWKVEARQDKVLSRLKDNPRFRQIVGS